jgi:hypothetical protein
MLKEAENEFDTFVSRAVKAAHPNRIFNLGQRYYFASFQNSAP